MLSAATSSVPPDKLLRSVPPPPPPDTEALIVIASLVALVYKVTFEPATRVNESVVLSATTSFCPATTTLLNAF